MNIRDVIIAPVITEKSMRDAAMGRYTFKVATAANKPFIKQAIEEKFKVKVASVYQLHLQCGCPYFMMSF